LGGRNFWVNPSLRPIDGNTVLVRTDDVGKLMTWPNDYVQEPAIEQHVVVLMEMV